VADKNAAMLMVYFLTPLPVIRRALSLMGIGDDQIDGEADKMVVAQARAFAGVYRKAGKPVVGYSWRGAEERFSQELMASGVPLFGDPARAAKALAALVRYPEQRAAG